MKEVEALGEAAWERGLEGFDVSGLFTRVNDHLALPRYVSALAYPW
jgi:hypothetical protein